MKWLLYVVAVIAVLIGAVVLLGHALPATTKVSRSITLQQPPAAVFANLSTRGLVGTGDDVMIGGFIVGGATGCAKVVTRARDGQR